MPPGIPPFQLHLHTLLIALFGRAQIFPETFYRRLSGTLIRAYGELQDTLYACAREAILDSEQFRVKKVVLMRAPAVPTHAPYAHDRRFLAVTHAKSFSFYIETVTGYLTLQNKRNGAVRVYATTTRRRTREAVANIPLRCTRAGEGMVAVIRIDPRAREKCNLHAREGGGHHLRFPFTLWPFL